MSSLNSGSEPLATGDDLIDIIDRAKEGIINAELQKDSLSFVHKICESISAAIKERNARCQLFSIRRWLTKSSARSRTAHNL